MSLMQKDVQYCLFRSYIKKMEIIICQKETRIREPNFAFFHNFLACKIKSFYNKGVLMNSVREYKMTLQVIGFSHGIETKKVADALQGLQ